jgi:Uma2 family endonuclease
MATIALPDTNPSASSVANGDALYEVIHGQRVELPPMSIFAVRLATKLTSRLDRFVDEQALGMVVCEGLFILDQQVDLRRRPDVAFVSKERWPLDRPLPTSGDWPVVPDLAVEVVSPNDEMAKVVEKMKEYFRYQVRQVWLIVPTQGIIYVHDSPSEVHALVPNQELTSTLLPGFRLPVAELFS